MFACSRGHVNIARLLVAEFHANIDITDKVIAVHLCLDVRCGRGGHNKLLCPLCALLSLMCIVL